MCRFLFLPLLVLVNGFTLQSISRAATLYSQVLPEEPVGAFSSQDESSGQAVADNFLITGTVPLTVRSIRLIGVGTGDPNVQPRDDFRVLFFQDAGGMPGSIVPGGDFDGGLLAVRSATGGMLINGSFEPIIYGIDLRIGLLLNPNTEYWMAVTNDPGLGFGWAWARANGVLDSQTVGTSDSFASPSWELFDNGGMWFELSDQNIPEPSSLLLLLTSFTATHLLRRQRKST